jgi:hypothetical protein
MTLDQIKQEAIAAKAQGLHAGRAIQLTGDAVRRQFLGDRDE